ncbi:hypothetical protein BC832DRAFT_543272 [Gaertneriomyces semiglobifer]|nr:hypothetical protein BC832DRAFT_543272 [Gaertneriomyces semiglobifer]
MIATTYCQRSAACRLGRLALIPQQHHTRSMASLKKTLLTRPTGVNPPLFHQTIVHSDGSTFSLPTTSPRSILKLTKDTRNHPLWNPALNVLDDQSGELAKFEKAFGDLGDLADLASFEVAEEAAPKSPAPTPAASAGKKGKKK